MGSLHNTSMGYLFEILLIQHELRSIATDLQIPKKNSASGQKRFSFWGAKLWNSLLPVIILAAQPLSRDEISTNH